MKKFPLLFSAIVFLVTACASPTQEADTAIVSVPTPTIDYQIVGSTKYNFMVVVDPASSMDRKGLMSVCEYICDRSSSCIIWIWDDIDKADTSYPIDPAAEEAMIAEYTFNWGTWEGTLVMHAAGDE